MHPQDQAYTVQQLAALVNSTGLKITGFVLPSAYDPLRYIAIAQLKRTVQSLPLLERAAFVEALRGTMKKHTVWLAHRDRPTVQVNAEDPDVVPHLRTMCHVIHSACACHFCTKHMN